MGEIADGGYIVGIVKKITMNKRAKTNSIRIIAGDWRGRRIPVLDHEGLRPTTDRVRETVFNWLMYDTNDANCLDLFAGSGVLGLECLSRKASFVQFVEKNKVVASSLSQNLNSLLAGDDSNGRAAVSNSSALDFLSKPSKGTFDLVFLDPPFKDGLLPKAVSLLVENNWLSDDALVYLECDSSDQPFDMPEGWALYKKGKAGQSAYFLYTTG